MQSIQLEDPSVHAGRLMLTPQDPRSASPGDHWLRSLAELGLLDPAFNDTMAFYRPGHSFLDLIAFTGCAVQLPLISTAQGAPGSCIRVLGPTEQPRLIAGRNTRAPRCPHCRAPQRGWTNHRALWESGITRPIVCEQCATGCDPCTLDWKYNGGFGRLFLVVEEVFPGEAVPTPRLLRHLQDHSALPWRYFYVQDP